MQCSIRLDKDRNCGNVKMKTINNYKNPYQKEPNLDIIVDQLAIRLQDIKDQEGTVGMPTCSIEQAEAVRRYYAAFPALTKGETSPLQYRLPPPAWCKKQPAKMHSQDLPKDWKKKIPTGKERRNSYQGQRKNKKHCKGHSRSWESKDNLPEWMTHEGIWSMEEQDPVREFIRAIALDEGYGTCENTAAEEPRAVPQWDDGLDMPVPGHWLLAEAAPPRAPSPADLELYARFEAKFDRSLEALWTRDQNTPDDDYQELPIDFAELLSSPSDRMFGAPPPPPPRFASALSPPSLCSLPSLGSLGDAVWSCEARPSPPLHARLRPLHLASPPPRPAPPPPEPEAFAYDGDELYDALASVADTVRSLTALNHSRDTSGFCEVPPRRRAPRQPSSPRRAPPPPPPPPPPPESEREDLLTAARTHFRPIEREPEAEAPRYADGDTFDIRGEPDAVQYRRSGSGGAYLDAGRYLECRGAPAPLRFRVHQTDAGVQTEPPACDECASRAKKMRPAESGACVSCAAPAGPPPAPRVIAEPGEEETTPCDWEELLADISAAHAHYSAAPAESGADRKRRHSAALRCARHCAHPHARFLPCRALDRPLTR